MSYKKNAGANRDALFGNVAPAAPKTKSSTNRKPAASNSKSLAKPAPSSNRGYQSKATGTKNKPRISAEVKAAKIKEAEDYKKKANKAMESGFFKSADPVAASTFYKRAADCYQLAQEERLERLYRLQSAECNFTIQAWAGAAGDYLRAAELLLNASNEEGMSTEQIRRDASSYYKKASEAWTEMGEKAKAAEAQIQAAMAVMGNTSIKDFSNANVNITKEVLTGLEEAVEAFVPDVLNPYGRYRQTGQSAFLAEDETIVSVSPATRQFAESHMVTRSYAHEPLQQVVHLLVRHGEYPSALFAAGAASTLLERDGVSTLSLGRAYCTETILMLAQGDPIGAEERFLNRHCQSTPYLTSRESKLSEELFRAIKTRDADALEEARDPSGSNRAALANLHESLRTLVTELRLSGVARKVLPGEAPVPKPKSSKKTRSKEAPPEKPLSEVLNANTGYEADVAEGVALDSNGLQDELDALNFDDDDSLEDDDIDLR